MPSVPSCREFPPDAPCPADEAGIRFRLNIPGLSYEGFMHMQAVLSGRHMSKGRVDSGLVALAVLALAGGGLIALAFALDISSGLHIDVKRTDWSTNIGGGPLVLIIAMIAAAAYYAATWGAVAQSLRYTRSLYGEMSALLGPQQLELTDEGFTVHNDTGSHFIRWTAVNDLILSEGVWFIVIQGGSAQWLPEATIRAIAEPDVLRRFLRAKTGK
jgi:hypothetical protein